MARGGDTVRLFAAVYPSPDAVAALRETLTQERSDLRWVPIEQWHVTTAFYGEVPQSSVADLAERLQRAAARTPALTLSLQGGGTFPRRAAQARHLWVGVGGDGLTGLRRLAERCVAAGRRVGIDVDDRPYRPHLTLARARALTADLRGAVEELSAYQGPAFVVASLHLVKSTLGASVTHDPVAVLPLTG